MTTSTPNNTFPENPKDGDIYEGTPGNCGGFQLLKIMKGTACCGFANTLYSVPNLPDLYLLERVVSDEMLVRDTVIRVVGTLISYSKAQFITGYGWRGFIDGAQEIPNHEGFYRVNRTDIHTCSTKKNTYLYDCVYLTRIERKPV
jgi:hypothetical protein